MMTRRLISVLFLLASLVGASAFAETFYWTVPEKEWGRYGDLANWAVGGPEGTPATRLPDAIPEHADRFYSQQGFSFDLGGTTNGIGFWMVDGWTPRNLRLTNGVLRVGRNWSIHGGTLDILNGATLLFDAAALFYPGANDARGRQINIAAGGMLDLGGAEFNMFNGGIRIDRGGRAILSHRALRRSFKNDFPIENNGRLSLPDGFAFSSGNEGSTTLKLNEGSLTEIGGDITTNTCRTALRVVIAGGHLVFHGNCVIEATTAFVQTNASVIVEVADGKYADMRAFSFGPGVCLEKRGGGMLILDAVPEKLDVKDGQVMRTGSREWFDFIEARRLDRVSFEIRGSAANRCYFIFMSDPERIVASVTYTFPHPDAGRADGLYSATVTTPFFHRRYPENGGRPFKVIAEINGKNGVRRTRELEVTFTEKPITAPHRADDVLLGTVSYGTSREFPEMITNNLCRVFAGWNATQKFLPGFFEGDWLERGQKAGLYGIMIYGTTPPAQIEEIKRVWGERFLGNNIGEYAGFLYGAPKEMRGAQNMNLTEAREWFISKFIEGRQRFERGASGCQPRMFSTSGAAFAGYELQGGIDFVCNELYAVGCANLAYATAEARGAARKWKPEWWSGWLAHEWQTFPIPYQDPHKYLSLEAGIKMLYVMGTSLMVLESGSSGTQAHPHTWEADRAGYKYDDDPPTQYRRTLKKCNEWILANPRDKGSPETRIALALGCNDGYIGMTGDAIAPWGQHTNRLEHAGETPNIWAASWPEQTWERTRAAVLPAPPGSMGRFGSVGTSGTPFGQIDVVGIDDESYLSDLVRYRLIAFGGWNTMTPAAANVLTEWLRGGRRDLLMCVPQLTTRDDRDFIGYGPADLYPLIPGLDITGVSEAEGEVIFDEAKLPGVAAELGGGRKSFNGRIATCRLGDGVEVVARVSGHPLIVRRKFGEGYCYLLLAWDFPGGNRDLGDIWAGVLRALAAEVPQRVTLSPVDGMDERVYFNFGVYETKAYLLNLDGDRSRSVRVNLPGGRSETLTLAPLEIRIIPL